MLQCALKLIGSFYVGKTSFAKTPVMATIYLLALAPWAVKQQKFLFVDPRQEKFVVLYYKTLQICNAWIIW